MSHITQNEEEFIPTDDYMTRRIRDLEAELERRNAADAEKARAETENVERVRAETERARADADRARAGTEQTNTENEFNNQRNCPVENEQTGETKSEESAAHKLLQEKMEKMEAAFRKAQGGNDQLYSLGHDRTQTRLPPKLNMDGIPLFNGLGDPKQHLRQYASTMKLKGLEPEQLAQAFQMSLSGAAAKWYHSQDPTKFKEWDNLVDDFVKQFAYNTEVDVTLRDLETTQQRNNETFSEFITRWRIKAAKMTIRPSETDQVSMVIKSLSPSYGNHMLPMPIETFSQLCLSGNRIEDALNSGRLRKVEENVRHKMTYGSWPGSEGHKTREETPIVNAVTRTPQKAPRQFDDFGIPQSEVYERLLKERLIEPLDPVPIPNPLPANFRHNDFCAFHQTPGHTTDQCKRIRHEIQDLIDDKVIPKPNDRLPANINHIDLNPITFDPSTLIRPISNICTIPISISNITPYTIPKPIMRDNPNLVNVMIWGKKDENMNVKEQAMSSNQSQEEQVDEEVMTPLMGSPKGDMCVIP